MNTCAGILFLVLAAATASAQSTNIENLAKNPGFEMADATAVLPEDWGYFSSKGMNCTLTADAKRSGDRCVKFRTQGTRYAHTGLAQTVPVEPGRKYTFTAFVRNNEKELLGRSTWGMLGIEWQDQNKKELGRIESAHWTRTLSRMRWESFEVSGKAPAGAVSAAFVIHLDDGDPAGEGSYFVDDVLITVK